MWLKVSTVIGFRNMSYAHSMKKRGIVKVNSWMKKTLPKC